MRTLAVHNDSGKMQKSRAASFSKVNESKNSSFFFQPKLTINQPNDIYEQEADIVAEQVMRLPTNKNEPAFFKPSLIIQNKIQREDTEAQTSDETGNERTTLTDEYDRRLDWFEMSRPFTTRSAHSMLYFDDNMYFSIGNAWTNNYNLFFNFGLSDELSADAANFFTPFAIDSALKRDFPTASELFERDADISSIVLSPTLLNFDIQNIPGTLRFPFLKIFGVDQPNPYAPVQRKCAECEEEEKLQRKENNLGKAETGNELETYIGNLNSGGTYLPDNVRSFFEPRFGYDFSNVKIHNDSAAAKSAESVNALAYTSGNNIVFNQNQYSPETNNGKRLLAHELTHVVQQENIAQKKIQRDCDAAKKTFAKQADIQLFVVADDDGASPTKVPRMIAVDRVWERCCIHMNVLGVKTIKDTSSKVLEVGGGTASAKETSLAANKVSNAINVFTVSTFKKGGVESKNHSGGGRTFYLGTSNPVSIMVEGAIPTVVAHEIGHGLRGNTDHEAGTIMEGSGAYDSPNPDKVSDTVCSTARGWGQLKDISDKPFECCIDY